MSLILARGFCPSTFFVSSQYHAPISCGNQYHASEENIATQSKQPAWQTNAL
jgi:hypothetical protein